MKSRERMLYDYFRDITFANPRMLTLLAFIPMLTIWYIMHGRKKLPAFRLSSIGSFERKSVKVALSHLPFILRLIAIGSVVIVLARPQLINNEQQRKGEGIDIMLSLDVSGSMLSKDFQPNRLTVMKEIAAEFIRSRPVDRIGIVIFSGESYSMAPLTTDKETLLAFIESIRSGMLVDGTVIGEGLATAVDRMENSTAQSRIVILLTDGKEEAPETRLVDPLTALEIAKAKGVKVYCIGMSAQNFTPIAENVPGLRKQNAGIFLDEDLLRRIAKETGGQYFRARDKLGLRDIYEQIDRLEKSEMEVIDRTRVKELFVPFLLTALGLIFAEIFLRFTLFKRFP